MCQDNLPLSFMEMWNGQLKTNFKGFYGLFKTCFWLLVRHTNDWTTALPINSISMLFVILWFHLGIFLVTWSFNCILNSNSTKSLGRYRWQRTSEWANRCPDSTRYHYLLHQQKTFTDKNMRNRKKGWNQYCILYWKCHVMEKFVTQTFVGFLTVSLAFGISK